MDFYFYNGELSDQDGMLTPHHKYPAVLYKVDDGDFQIVQGPNMKQEDQENFAECWSCERKIVEEQDGIVTETPEQLRGYTFMAFAVVVSVVFKLSSFSSDPPQEPEPIEACFLGNFDLYKSKLNKEYFAAMMDVVNLGEKRKRESYEATNQLLKEQSIVDTRNAQFKKYIELEDLDEEHKLEQVFYGKKETVTSFGKFMKKHMYKCMIDELDKGMFKDLELKEWITQLPTKYPQFKTSVADKLSLNFITTELQTFDEDMFMKVANFMVDSDSGPTYMTEKPFEFIKVTGDPTNRNRKSSAAADQPETPSAKKTKVEVDSIKAYDVIQLKPKDDKIWRGQHSDINKIWAHKSSWYTDEPKEKETAVTCPFEWDTQYVVVYLGNTNSHTDYGFKVNKGNDPYKEEQPFTMTPLSKSNNPEHNQYKLPVIGKQVLSTATINNKFKVVGHMDKSGKVVLE